MSRFAIWAGGILAFLTLSTLCIRRHLPELQAATPPVAAAPVAAVAPAAMPAMLPALEATVGADGRVTLSGRVPDEGARSAIVSRAVQRHGRERVVDRIEVVAGAAAPWFAAAAAGFPPDLARLSGGARARLADGTLVLEGVAPADELRAGLAQAAAAALPGITIDNRVTLSAAATIATDIGAVLKQRIVEFASGSAALTPNGQATLDAIVPLLARDTQARFVVAGHTDSLGEAATNQALSEARARTVRDYLVANGVAAARLTPRGYGAQSPVADNATAEGRQRNRRIVFEPQ